MRNYFFNGERWHLDSRPVLRRIRRWIASVGLRELKDGRLADEGEILPLGMFGHRLTFFGHWFQVKTPWGWLVVHLKRDPMTGEVVRHGLLRTVEVESAFVSVNGTPQNAYMWFVGTPADIVKHVEARAVA